MRVEIPLTEDDKKRLAHALGRDAEVERVATLVARAGAAELLAQATGRAVPATLAELHAYRIFYLLQQGMDLSESEALVAAIFKVPSNSAKRMVNAAVARFAVELQEGLAEVIVQLLEEASWVEARRRWEVRIPSTFVKERILDVIGRLPLPNPESAQRGPIWHFSDETYQALRAEFGLTPKSQEA